jgi:hypothetical protein
MNKVKTFEKFLNESTLYGEDISYYLNKLEEFINNTSNINKNDLLFKLRSIFNIKDILFMGVDKISFIFPEFNKDNYTIIKYGIIGAFIASDLTIYVIINEEELLHNLYKNKLNTLYEVKKVLNHELVHREQYKRMGNKLYYILTNVKSKTYLDNPREIMAYAKTVTDELMKNFKKEEIIDFLRSGTTITTRHKDIKQKVQPKNYKKFLKHMYNYIINSRL